MKIRLPGIQDKSLTHQPVGWYRRSRGAFVPGPGLPRGQAGGGIGRNRPRMGDNEAMARPAVFLDRDGTLIEDVGYVDRIERLHLYPWSVECVRLLRRAGYAVVVVTNQPGVARGMVDERAVQEARDEIQRRLAAVGQRLDGHFACPHLVDAALPAYRRDCNCHKPRPGLVEQAVSELDLDPRRSVVVGDRWTDLELARAVGARAVLVRTGYGASQERRPVPAVAADAVVDTLVEAVGWILGERPAV